MRRNNMIMTVKHYQNYLSGRLSQYFKSDLIVTEWSSMIDESDLKIYSPRLDLAVGPFATNQRYGKEYDNMLNGAKVERLIQRLIKHSNKNLKHFGDDFVQLTNYEDIKYQNYNARCFLAIEIENQVSRKHLMGGAINAAALGRIGIVIPWTDEKLRAFVRLVRYLRYLGYAEKNTFNTENLLIVTKEQLDDALDTMKTDEN